MPHSCIIYLLSSDCCQSLFLVLELQQWIKEMKVLAHRKLTFQWRELENKQRKLSRRLQREGRDFRGEFSLNGGCSGQASSFENTKELRIYVAIMLSQVSFVFILYLLCYAVLNLFCKIYSYFSLWFLLLALYLSA